MRRYLPWIVLGIGVGLSACATPRCSPPPDPQAIASRIETTKACASWQWIGVTRPGSPCPKVSGWKEGPLFEPRKSLGQKPNTYQKEPYPDPGATRSTPDPEVIRELERFCVYTIEDPNKKLQDVPFPPAVDRELVRFDQDCAMVSTSASKYLDQVSGATLRKHFLEQVGRAGVPPTFDGSPNVRLAFLDTHPTDEGTWDVASRPPRSWHGYTLVEIAQELVHDPDGQSAARVTTRLTLPIVSFDPKNQKRTKEDLERGGFIGTQSHLAKAIREEVDRWRRGSERHLVLNLSLAWDEKLFGGLDEERMSDVRAGTQAVYWALRYAAAHDVLVLAAAGNQRTPCPKESSAGPCPNTGLLLPAAWESKSPAEDCARSRPATIVYAVGGLQSNGDPLINARPGGMPKRAAYGEYAVVRSAHPDQPTKIYMGSSVATAVVASIAAVVWDSLPDLSSREVMDILDASGDPTPSSGVHKISFCRTVQAACASRPSALCPISIGSTCPPTQSALPAVVEMDVPPANSCQPWLFPQPGDYPCLGCPPKTE